MSRLARALPGLARRALRRPRPRRRRAARAGGIKVVHGEARFNRADRVAVRTPEGGVAFLEFEHAIVATGSRPVALPGLPGDGERVRDSTGARR